MRRQKKLKKHQGVVKIGKRSRGIIFLSRPSTLSAVFSSLAVVLLIGGLTLGGIPVVWMVWYRLSPETSSALAAVLKRPITGFHETLVKEGIREPVAYQPPLDTSLPTENRLIVSKLGIDTPIVEEPTERYEEAFRRGVWRVPDFGTSYDRELPMILAAHRFGYLNWSVKYRLANSFYNLPKLQPGGQVEVIWNQRRYIYEIYAQEEGKEISQYTADLVLYTCKFLESDVRIFRYGRLLEKQYFEVGKVASPSSGQGLDQ
jgi:sortase (surface protein transpeptidase)